MEGWHGSTGEEGQSYDIFDWGTTNGTFSTLDFSGAPLASGLIWDTSKLYLTGEINVTTVLEPRSFGMLLAGLGMVGGAAGASLIPSFAMPVFPSLTLVKRHLKRVILTPPGSARHPCATCGLLGVGRESL